MSGHIDLQEMNRSLRDAVRRHANFQTMTESLSPHTRQIVDALLSGDVTPQMVRTARLALRRRNLAATPFSVRWMVETQARWLPNT